MRMRTSKPLSAVTLEQSVANFPSLKVLWNASGVSADGKTWTDNIHGYAPTHSGGNLSVVNGPLGDYVFASALAYNVVTAPVLYPAADEDLLVIFITGEISGTSQISFGNTASDGIQVATNSGVIKPNALDYCTPTSLGGVAVSTGETAAFGVMCDFDGDSSAGADGKGAVRSFKIINDGTQTYNTAGAAAGDGANDMIANGWTASTDLVLQLIGSNDEIYGIYVLFPKSDAGNYWNTEVKPNLMQYVEWMRSNPSKGLHPVFGKVA